MEATATAKPSVIFLQPMKPAHLRAPKQTLALLTFGLGLLAFLALWFRFRWQWYWAWWSGFSAITFLAYGFDKLEAKRDGGQRIPDVVLHLLALAGGVAGGWIGSLLFRHKTRHATFAIVLILATALHFLLWYFVLRRR